MNDIMMDIGPIPEGWEFQPVHAGEGGVAYRLGEALVVVQPSSVPGYYVSVQGRSPAGATVVAYAISEAPPKHTLRQLLAIVAPHCPALRAWIEEAPCTPS